MRTPNLNGLTGLVVAIGGLWLGSKVLGLFTDDVPPGPPPPVVDEVPTLTLIELRAMCDTIMDALAAYAVEDEDRAVDTVLRCNNTADLQWLLSTFGTRFVLRRLSFFTLPQLLVEYLSTADLDRLNDGLAAKGINFSF